MEAHPSTDTTPAIPVSLNDVLVGATFTTDYGDASFADMRRAYENEKRRNEKRKQFFKTDEGKAYNRQKAKVFYQRHREEILSKRKESYEAKKQTA
jgi:hypothetical protein